VKQHTAEYDRYIRSPEWTNRVNQRMRIANHRCELCGRLESNAKLQCHHISYQRLGNEDVANDLIIVCGRCHLLLHKYYNRARTLVTDDLK
jgi:hypothetical protein